MSNIAEPNFDYKKNEELFDAVFDYTGRFISYPSDEAHIAHVGWILHTHVFECFDTTPRLAILSPEPGSGKTRLLEVTASLVRNPIMDVGGSQHYVLRKASDEENPPTLLIDETDTIFGNKAKEKEDLRGLLNAGYRKGAKSGRCVVVGKKVEAIELNAFAPVALAGLGWLPDTILTRSIIIRMKRRKPGEHLDQYRIRVQRFEADALRDDISRWADSVRPLLQDFWPQIPSQIQDRDADCWEPLLAIGESAGSGWSGRMRYAGATLVGASKELNPSLGVRLLMDLRDIFLSGEDRLPTSVVLQRLISLQESPWSDMRGKPLNAESLSRRLKQYDIHSARLESHPSTVRGYLLSDLKTAFDRYLPTPPQKPGEPDPVDPDDTDFQERAAVLEIDHGLDRAEAERRARQ